jgi:hypothetical protein
MNRVTLAVVAVLLAVPAVAQAKAGIEFNSVIETQQPGDRQSFTAIVMNEPSDPMGGEPKPIVGVHPLVAFKNQSTGKVIRVRTSRTDRDGIATGSVVFPDRGPWTATLFVNGKAFGPGEDQGFSVGPLPTASAPAAPAKADSSDGGGFPAWLLSIPAAFVVALGIRHFRRRPRELGA